jgi:hypothetical protein
MRRAGILVKFIAAAAVGLLWLGCNAQAEDVDYSKIGWWQIVYREVETLNGCQATARFQDQTEVSMALIQDGDRKSWMVYIYNPRWTWVRKNTQHVLFFALINPN